MKCAGSTPSLGHPLFPRPPISHQVWSSEQGPTTRDSGLFLLQLCPYRTDKYAYDSTGEPSTHATTLGATAAVDPNFPGRFDVQALLQGRPKMGAYLPAGQSKRKDGPLQETPPPLSQATQVNASWTKSYREKGPVGAENLRRVGGGGADKDKG